MCDRDTCVGSISAISRCVGLYIIHNTVEIKIIHVDLYRIKKYEKNYIDFYNYHTEKSLFLIEWIDNDQKLMQNQNP